MNLSPFLMSQTTTTFEGNARCIGVSEHAINLQLTDGRLLTPPFGKGLSPFGWVLRRGVFTQIKDQIQLNQPVFLSPEALHMNFLKLPRQARKYPCHSQICPPYSEERLLHFLCATDALPPTGLWGDLLSLITSPLNSELKQMYHDYCAWLDGGSIDWRPFIGKGQGLTPSNDDTLVGMLLVTFSDARLIAHPLRPFLLKAHQQTLSKLTTYMSVAYLNSALEGNFSTPLLHLNNAALKPHKYAHALRAIAHLGHTSGIDTLLGIWLASKALARYFRKH